MENNAESSVSEEDGKAILDVLNNELTPGGMFRGFQGFLIEQDPILAQVFGKITESVTSSIANRLNVQSASISSGAKLSRKEITAQRMNSVLQHHENIANEAIPISSISNAVKDSESHVRQIARVWSIIQPDTPFTWKELFNIRLVRAWIWMWNTLGKNEGTSWSNVQNKVLGIVAVRLFFHFRIEKN